MELLSSLTLQHGKDNRRIEILHGDLARLPPSHAVDVLIVSAFPNEYLETPRSLIGALARNGISVRDLALHKQIDMRQQFSCWLSQRVEAHFNFSHLLCIESGWRGSPPEITDDLFAALAPFLLTDFRNGSVAMPLIGAGDQAYGPVQMLEAILNGAVAWIERGLKLRLLKIIVHNDAVARDAASFFESFKRKHQPRQNVGPGAKANRDDSDRYDVFISYSHTQALMANFLVSTLKTHTPTPSIFINSERLSPGTSWPTEIATALDASRRVVALYSPDYWASRMCKLELSAAWARQTDSGQTVLFPLLLEEVAIPYLFRTLQHVDCRINDKGRLADACSKLAGSLS